jgi:hypothetical protein
MEHQVDIRTPIGVMDQDSTPEVIADGNYRSAMGIVNTSGDTPGGAFLVKGSTKIEVDLPEGINVYMGGVEDKRTNSFIYFVYNLFGNHRVLRWNADEVSFLNPLGTVDVLAEGEHLGFQPEYRINHAEVVDSELLYWVASKVDKTGIEGNMPKKLNIVKSIKQKKILNYWLYAGLPNQGQFASLTTITFTVYNADGSIAWPTSVLYQFFGSVAEGSPQVGLALIQAGITNYLALNPFAPISVGDLIDCKLELSAVGAGRRLVVESSDGLVRLVSRNHYDTIIEEHVSLKKYKPRRPPFACYESDPNVKYNYVKDKLIQFRIRTYYNDGERSEMGPISNVALPLNRDGVQIDSLNHIKIDFTEDRFSDADVLSDIKGVEILFREGNTGLWKLAEFVDACRLGIGENYYRFFNDRLYNTVASDDDGGTAETQAIKPYDFVPHTATSLAAISDKNGNTKLLIGAGEENREPPEEAKIEWAVTSEQEEDCTITITGRITCRAIFDGYSNGLRYYTPTGGIDQPLGGFVVYLAGTEYYGISNSAGVNADGTFEITDVPRGRYIMRVAGYRVVADNSNGPVNNLTNGLEWQKTSAPVFDCAGSLAATGVRYERELDLTSVSNIFNLLTEPGYGDIRVDQFRRNPNLTGTNNYNLGHNTGGIEGYFLYNENGYSSNADRFASSAIERQSIKARVALDVGATTLYGEPTMETDHNGYFYGVFDQGGVTSAADVEIVEVLYARMADVCDEVAGDTKDVNFQAWGTAGEIWDTLFAGSEVDHTSNLTDGSDATSAGTSKFLAVFLDDASTGDNARALVEGQILDSTGSPIENALVAMTRNGKQERTDVNGNYSFLVWCPWDASSFSRDDDTIYLLNEIDSCYDFPPSPEIISPQIGVFCSDIDKDTPFDIEDVVYGFSGVLTLKDKYLKAGGVYKTGIVYEDKEGRRSTVAPGPLLKIPFHTEVSEFGRKRVGWGVSGRPPLWADRYTIVLTKDSIYRRYFTWVVDEARYAVISDIDANPVTTTFGAGNATHIMLKLNPNIDPVDDAQPVNFFYKQTNYFGFEPQIGDRVRLVLDSAGTLLSNTEIFDYEIVGTYIDGDDYFAVIKNEPTFEVEDNSLVEFYTPKKVEEQKYYAWGDTYDIINPGTTNRLHAGPVQNQTAIPANATGFLVGGDTYWRERNFPIDAGTLFNYLTENPNVSDLFESTVSDIGEPSVEDVNFKERFQFQRIRISDTYLPETEVNGLNSFRGTNYLDIDRSFGPIRKLQVHGSTLLAICEHKLQPLYIGQNYILDLEGNQTVGRSSQILNPANQTVQDWGTQHPESIVKDGSFVYGFDASRGITWKYSQNGQRSTVSLMSNYWQALGKRLMEKYGDSLAIGGIDRDRKAYILTFWEGRDTEIETIMYSEEKDGWISFQPYIPYGYGQVGNQVLHFLNGEIWLPDTNETRMNFFDTQYEGSIVLVFNQNPGMTKDFHNIEVLDRLLWEASEITTPANNQYPDGQLSRLKAAKWQALNNKWAADFLRDINDPAYDSVTPEAQRQVTALHRGRILKNNVIRITLTPNDSTKDHLLRQVSVEWTPAMDTKP